MVLNGQKQYQGSVRMEYHKFNEILQERIGCTTQCVEFVADGDKEHIFYLSGNNLGDLVDNLEKIKKVVPSHKIFEYSQSDTYSEMISEDADPVYIDSVKDFKDNYLT